MTNDIIFFHMISRFEFTAQLLLVLFIILLVIIIGFNFFFFKRLFSGVHKELHSIKKELKEITSKNKTDKDND